MKALTWRGADVAVADVPAPARAAGRALIDVAYAGICGTDLHICDGEHPRAKPDLIIGHEFAGRLAEPAGGLAAGTPVTVEPLLWCGRCPACLRGARHVCERLRMIGIDEAGAVAEQVSVPAELLLPLPPAMDLRFGAFVEPLAVAVHAVRRSRLRLGEVAVVVGAGPIGLAVALCARLAGAAEVLVVEPAAMRGERARALGFEVVDSAVGQVVFDTAAVPSVAASTTGWVEPGGRIVFVGVYARPAPVDLQRVTFAELEMIGTRVYERDDLRTAIRLLDTGAFDPRPLLTRTLPLRAADTALDLLRSGSEIKVLIEVAS
uniref:zinc-dependent alcohol dehydrogenase n=1 Tax=Paractinoplanes polyasparticus TaxID=2856853 RepID=UPI001C853CD4|nr:alcohol dehydrogenase catalytic domain-containing protein [Actinoplanes polyasparticus]